VDIVIPWQVKASLRRPGDVGQLEKSSLGDALGGELGQALASAVAAPPPPPPAPLAAVVASSSSSSATPASGDDANTMAFVLMTRKGNKPQFKSLAVASDSDLALNLRNREQVRIPRVVFIGFFPSSS